MTYKEKAKKLINSGFWMAGFGNFDITTDELALVLENIEKEDFLSIENLYNQLQEERL